MVKEIVLDPTFFVNENTIYRKVETDGIIILVERGTCYRKNGKFRYIIE